ncbi:MAG TPA: hypothetical protein VMD56_12515 [Steroidobacteraceae bacterium]|nr:hypothetical protein [Steroidobacteraceae bacterium]
MTELHRAISAIRSIRGQLARGTEFRGYGPATLTATGMLALLGAAAQYSWLGGSGAAARLGLMRYLSIWVPVAALSLALIVTEAALRTRRLHRGLALEMMRAALEQFLPPLCAGLLLTVIIVATARGSAWMLPGLWQIIFSLGVFASCRFLPPGMFAVGVWYLAAGLGCLALGTNARALSPWAMGIPFGVGQLLVAGVLQFGYRRADE